MGKHLQQKNKYTKIWDIFCLVHGSTMIYYAFINFQPINFTVKSIDKHL